MSIHHYTLTKVPLFRDAFRVETEKGLGRPGQPDIYPVLTLTLPSGTRRYSSASVGSAANGLALPKVTQWGTIARSVSERQASLNAVEVDVGISDLDRSFAKEVASYRASLRRSPATITFESPNVTTADTYVAFVGIVDSYSQNSPGFWSIRLRPDDVQLRNGKVPKVAITTTDWPNCDPTLLGQYVPIIYGIHDSSSLSGTGMVPALKVDSQGFRYLVSLGRILSLDRVYVDGVLLAPANYSLTYVTVNGKVFSLIDFLTTQSESEITCDVHGLTDRADGTGSIISNPADQIKHYLVNFVWGDWRSGEYLADSSAPIHTGYFAEVGAYLTALGHEGSKYFAGDSQRDATSDLNEWLDSHDCRAFWTNSGHLAIRLIDPRTTDIYETVQWLKGNNDDFGGMSLIYDAKSLTPHVSSQFAFGEADGKYFSTTEIEDLSVTQDATIAKALPWSAARLT